jgi:hypothetical protein
MIASFVSVFVVACLSGVPANADVVTFKRAGAWEAFGGRSSNNRRLCGVSVSGGGRWFSIKYFEGDSNLTVQLSKDTWTVRNGLQINLNMQFDNESPWRASATTFHMDDGDAALQFTIGRGDVTQWIREFRASDYLYIRFPDSDVEDWRADLTGTPQIADAFTQCLDIMSGSQ